MANGGIDALLDLAPDPTLIVDRELRVAAAGEPAAHLFGSTREQLVGQPLDALIPGGVLDPELKLSATRADGTQLPIEISVRVLDGESDGPLLAVAIRDVTERRRRAATLREQGERFRRLFEDGPVAMALVGEDFRLAEVNDAFCELTGYTAAELATRTFADITHPDDVDIGVRMAHRNFAGELPGFSMDKRYVRKNGEVVWIELSVSPICDEDGQLVKSLGLMLDITERRQALTRAHERLERLARDRDRILEFAGEGIYHVDADGLITFANPAAAAMLGWPAEALIGKPAHEILHHTRADGEPYPREACPIHQPGRERTVEHVTDDRFWRRDGSSFPVHYTSAPVREPGARAGGAVIVFSDVSERVRMEAALRDAHERAARERLQAAETERSRWARELHDETLQGLAAVHVLLSSGIRASATDDMRGRMRLAQEQIEGELDKLRGLISDLRPAALDELGLAASVKDLAERTQVVYGIEVETTLALHTREGAPRRLASDVETAAYRITQECLSNAARHARASHIAVELGQADGSLHVCIRDDGRGFDVARETRGFGLRGMRERVDLLDGHLTIDSGRGAGTEVVASLPLTAVR
jgi:PAS domain S-box-containing protein